MTRADLAAHVEFFKELGVTGVSRDAAWRRRDSAADGADLFDETATRAAGTNNLGALRAHIG
ncbi:MAG: hypothetical protein ACHQO8_04500, partial [Vicinamibacterales bacterium]